MSSAQFINSLVCPQSFGVYVSCGFPFEPILIIATLYSQAFANIPMAFKTGLTWKPAFVIFNLILEVGGLSYKKADFNSFFDSGIVFLLRPFRFKR